MSFEIARKETLALVGESGSGKSTVAKMVVGLVPPTTGEVFIDTMPMHGRRQGAERRRLRRRIQMVFQDPYASLNPRWRALDIVAEPIRAFQLAASRPETAARVGELLRLVGLDPADGGKYPHQFSGGQRQRIAIARALASEPAFVVCDEPTSALDVSVQAQILNLMRRLQRRLGLTYLLISHNLAVVAHMADRIGVMYLGRLVEWGEANIVLGRPLHPYTRLLLDTIPDVEMSCRIRQRGLIDSMRYLPSQLSARTARGKCRGRCRYAGIGGRSARRVRAGARHPFRTRSEAARSAHAPP